MSVIPTRRAKGVGRKSDMPLQPRKSEQSRLSAPNPGVALGRLTPRAEPPQR
jgi:hypothetical protein